VRGANRRGDRPTHGRGRPLRAEALSLELSELRADLTRWSQQVGRLRALTVRGSAARQLVASSEFSRRRRTGTWML